MIYELFVNNYRKEIDSDKTPIITVGRPTEKNKPFIQLINPGISREQGLLYLMGEKLMYKNTGGITPEVINGEQLDPETHTTEMTLETILTFSDRIKKDLFRISRQPLQHLELEEESSDDPKTMRW